MSFSESLQRVLSFPLSAGRFLRRRSIASIDRETESLPPGIRDLMREVCRRTRLWRREQADVAQELAAHFLDGLETHRSETMDHAGIEDRLITEFGPPKQAAKLIRRAKIRCRPIWWRFQRRVRHAMIAAICLLVGYAGWILTGEPNVRVDYLSQWNSRHADVPMEDRAWPLYKKAFDAYQQAPNPLLTNGFLSGQLIKTASLDDPLVRNWVEGNRTSLSFFVAASRLPGYGRVYGLTEPGANEVDLQKPALWGSPEEPLPLLWVPLPELSSIRELTIAACARARLRAAEGDLPGALEDLSAILRTGNHLDQNGPTLIEHMVASGIVSIANETMRLILREVDVRDFDYADAGRKLSNALPNKLPIENWMQGEEDIVRDTIQRIFTEHWWGNGHLATDRLDEVYHIAGQGRAKPETIEAIALAMVHADRRTTIEMLDSYMTVVRRDLARPLYDALRGESDEFLRSLSAGELPGEFGYRYKYAVLSVIMPVFNRADAGMRLVHTDHEATLACIALHAYRRDHGQFPDTLGSLSPQYLASIPEDPYDGKPIKYRTTDSGADFVLYSIAGDFKDDGGAGSHGWTSDASPPEPVDYIFWPPAKRPD
jgi:hypothetical protein